MLQLEINIKQIKIYDKVINLFPLLIISIIEQLKVAFMKI